VNARDDCWSLAEYVGRSAQLFPDRLAIASEVERVTYRDLAARTCAVARLLLREGVRPGDRVAVLTPSRADAYVVFLAVNAVGAIWLGINARYKLPEMMYVMEDAKPRFMFFAAQSRGYGLLPIAGEVRAACPFVEKAFCLDDDDSVAEPLARALARLPDDETEYRDVLAQVDRASLSAMLVYTSGSTGNPKGVLLPNRSMIQRSRTQLQRWPVSDFPRVYNAYPMNHIGAMHWVASYAIVGGGTIHFREKFEADEIPDLVQREQINALEFFPTMYKMVLESPAFVQDKFASVEWHIFSGAQMPIECLRILGGMGGKIGTSFGMTETCGSVTYADPDTDIETLSITIGRPVPEGEVRVMADELRPCAEREVGEIQVRREFAMSGYFGRPEQTERAFTVDGWLKTGDLAEVLPRGNLRFVGRRSDMFKSGGYNVYPREIELAIEAHPAVVLAAVVGMPDPKFGEVGYAFVVPQSDATLDAATIREWCRARLADYKIPKQFEVSSELPLLPVGKVDKVELRRRIIESATART